MSPTRAGDTIIEEITINAPAERIFEALTNPEECMKWWGVKGQFETTHVESDLRPGGRRVMRGTGIGGKPFNVTGVYRQIERPRLHKVILLNDDYTPREFVVAVLKAEFRMNEDQAYRVMITAHKRGACVVAVFERDIAETKATRATEMGRSKGYPLLFTTEPEE